MDVILSYTDLQHIVLVKMCFFLYLAAAIVGVYRRWGYGYQLWALGITSGLAYFFLVHGMQLPFWGLEADEITIAAMYEMFAHAGFASDFAYAEYPAFYPPLWFWSFSAIGRVLDFNGIQIAKIGAVATFVFFPIVFYQIQKWFWSRQKGKGVPGPLAWFLGAVLLFVVIDPDAIITKPYELVSAALVVLWTGLLVYQLKRGALQGLQILWFGIAGGVLFLMFYFWFFLAAIGIALFQLFSRQRMTLQEYLSLAATGIIILIVGSPYWVPLARTYIVNGSENFQLGFFVIEWIATQGPLLVFSATGLVLFAGLVSLLWYRKEIYMRTLLSLFVAGYVWQIMGMVTIVFLASPLQESKGFFFWGRAALALAAAYGLARLWSSLSKRYTKGEWKRALVLVGILVLATQLIFGTFADDPKVLQTRQHARAADSTMRDLIGFLDHDYPNFSEQIVLHSSLVELHAFLPLNDFVYFNQHNSHPAAHFSQRYGLVQQFASATSSQALVELTQKNDFDQIDLFVFYTGDPDAYPVYFHLDDFPYRFRESIVNIPKELFAEEYFEKVFENGDYVVFGLKI